MVMGIGRGDSSRRVVGLQPVRVAEFERRCAMIKDLMNGRAVQWNDKELELKWVRSELPDVPMWIAGYGPKALAVAGRVGDGVIIQLADPVIIKWIMDTARRSARGGRPRPERAEVHRRRAEPHLRRHRRRARAVALVPGDGLEPRHGPDRALRRDSEIPKD
jgi:alkanesulfonate monooxygenase SsuD/methylene tetrahydromethanopterin reductase-like flavin-dependent oxidoreductase (luciferase family)